MHHVVDPRAVDLGYTNGLLSSIGDIAGSAWSFSDPGSNLASITEPNLGSGSPVWQYAYSGNYMSSVTDPNSNQSSFTLDNFHRLSGTSLPGGANTSDVSEQDFGYGSTNSGSPANLTLQSSVTPSSTDANGGTSTYQTDQFGDMIGESDPYGNVETVQRDVNGLPTVIT
ncbi:MAG TPA: hypothetical protein PK867_21690, partial [Pirellulales bacterium]|nr:hypothetical protein [Pirellulales bacterium]